MDGSAMKQEVLMNVVLPRRPLTSLKLNFLDKYIHTSYKCTNASNLTQYAILFDNSIILA